MKTRNHTKGSLLQDAAVVLLSVAAAVALVRTDILTHVLSFLGDGTWLGSFIAGLFFTSMLTTAPAIVMLGTLAKADAILPTALFGALGAVVGDIVIFRFVRDRFSEHILELLKHQHKGKRIRMIFKMRFFRWLSFFVGGLIIASPLPDELGIGLLGFSRIRMRFFVLLSFVFNFIGILLIGLAAYAI